jgi:hypothetical protein
MVNYPFGGFGIDDFGRATRPRFWSKFLGTADLGGLGWAALGATRLTGLGVSVRFGGLGNCRVGKMSGGAIGGIGAGISSTSEVDGPAGRTGMTGAGGLAIVCSGGGSISDCGTSGFGSLLTSGSAEFVFGPAGLSTRSARCR